ncbi:serine hydrolase [Streptomyces sp. NPDC058240]|uniref:serine hydrolase n=1 Tax=Streptomyces sp. NPDC058240 TaxID=3346396 RepID=UPI0036EEA6EC
MAGESPDKSEQQKSSGTARSESDPRLAVFREPSADDAAAGKTDTATAVFRTAPVTEDGEGAEGVDDPEPEGTEPEGSGVEEPSAEADGDTVADSEVEAEGPDGAVGAEEAEKTEGAAKGSEGPEKAPEASESADAGEPADAAADEAAAAKPAEGSGEGSEEGDARLRAAVAAWVTKDDEADGDDADSDDDAQGDDAKAATSKDEDAEGAEDADTDAAADAATASSDADAGDGDGDEPSDGASDDSDDKAPSAEKKKAEAEADDAAAEDKQGIDQPTAIFRAPAALRVDQPTTALKITPPGAKTAKPGSEAESKAESAAERTSKFVPLRGDDVRPASAPAPRKPEVPAASAAKPGTPPPTALSGAERTTQQPMPPRPPLDLLAELTNTPPPPETPVRTAVRRVKIWTPLVLLLVIVFAIVQMVRPLPDPELGLSVESAYTFDGDRLNLSWPAQGQSAVSVDGVGSMGSAGAQKPAPIASVAKVMTAYVVLKDHPLKGKEEGEKITVDQQAEDESKREDESTAPITKGQQFTQKQLLQLLMIPSGNNAARLFARWDAPSEKEFVAKMNAAAKELGMKNTTYTDPSGLDKRTVSTAEDQLKLARAVMQNDVFRGIVDTPEIKIPGIDQMIYNNNTILLEPGVSGIKTGSSTPAGGNLLWSANTVVDGQKLWIYGAVMGQQAGTGQPYDSLVMSLNNSLKLIKGAQKAVTSARVVKKGDVVGYVDDGLGGRTALVATRDLKAKGWPGLKVELSVSNDGKTIPHEASAGTTVGVVTVGTGPGRVSAPVALQEDLKTPGFSRKLTRIS